MLAEFTELGASVVGISADPVDRLRQFYEIHMFNFTLLSDSRQEIARNFGVRRPGRLPLKRITFVIDRDATVIRVIRSEMSMHVHAKEALKALQEKTSR